MKNEIKSTNELNKPIEFNNFNLLKKYFSGTHTEKTLKDYYYNFTRFLNFLENTFEINSVKEIKENHVLAYISHLKNEKELKNSTINTYIAAFRFFFKRAQSQYPDLKDPTKNISKLKSDYFDPEDVLSLNHQDIKDMINYIDVKDQKSYRNKMILKTLYYTGMRSDELRSLKYENLVEIDGQLRIKLFKTKSQKQQYIPLKSYFIDDILKYKNDIKVLFKFNNMNEKYVFPSYFLKNKKMTNSGLNKIIKKIAKPVIGKEISAHNFRHAIITILLLKGVSLENVSDFARHSNIKTTRNYDRAIEVKKAKTVGEIPDL